MDLVAGEGGPTPANVPETLGLDGPKLLAAANAFQLLLVQATCLLLLAQASGRPVRDAQGQHSFCTSVCAHLSLRMPHTGLVPAHPA